MKQMNSIFKYLSLIALVVSLGAVADAAGEKQRMIARASQISALKSAGIVGEQADGLLGFVKQSAGDQAVVAAENKDRNAVYTSIASSQGVSAKVVGGQRAKQLVGKAVRGQWFRDSGGKWHQK